MISPSPLLLLRLPLRCLIVTGLIVTSIWLGPLAVGLAQNADWVPTVKNHAWGRFGPNAWKVVRVRTQAFDEQGKSVRTSVTTTHTRVTGVDNASLSLCISATVAVAGQEFESAPQFITRKFDQNPDSRRKVGTEVLKIGAQEYTTDVIRSVVDKGSTRRTNTVYFCQDASPQVLKRVSTIQDKDSNKVNSETTMEVTEIGQMMEVLNEERSCWSVVTRTTRDSVKISTREVYCKDVPGELVSRTTEELNAKGQVVQRSELEVIGYGFGNQRRRLFGRRRSGKGDR